MEGENRQQQQANALDLADPVGLLFFRFSSGTAASSILYSHIFIFGFLVHGERISYSGWASMITNACAHG